MTSAEQELTRELVVRPGLFQYAYCCIFPAFFLFAGIGASLDPQARWFGLICLALAALSFAYIFGMRVEVSRESISKAYFFGLWRRSIPRSQVTVGRHREGNRGSHWSVVDFQREGKNVFSLTPGWVWRGRDVRAIVERVRPTP